MANQKLYILSLDDIPEQGLSGSLGAMADSLQSLNNFKKSFEGLTKQAGPPTGILPPNFSLPFNFTLPTDALSVYPKFTNALGAKTSNNNSFFESYDFREPIVLAKEIYDLAEPYWAQWKAALPVIGAYVAANLDAVGTTAVGALASPEVGLGLTTAGLGYGLYKMFSLGSQSNGGFPWFGGNKSDNSFFGGFGGAYDGFGGSGAGGTWDTTSGFKGGFGGGISGGGGTGNYWDFSKNFTGNGLFNNNSLQVGGYNPFKTNNSALDIGKDIHPDFNVPALPFFSQYSPFQPGIIQPTPANAPVLKTNPAPANKTGSATNVNVTVNVQNPKKEPETNTASSKDTVTNIKQMVAQVITDAVKDFAIGSGASV